MDYFKLFKVFDLRRLDKTGNVRLVQDRELGCKVLAVEGAISTSNFITFPAHKHPNVPFQQRFLYLLATAPPAKAFNMQLTYTLAGQTYRAVYSSIHK